MSRVLFTVLVLLVWGGFLFAQSYPTEVSIGPAPLHLYKGSHSQKNVESSRLTLTPGNAWSIEQANGFITAFDLATPDILPNVFPDPTPGFDNAGDFGLGDQSYFYLLDVDNNFMEVDTSTGATTLLGTPAPITPGHSWTGMATDPTDGTIYAVSCDITTTDLYTLDPATGTATLVGPVGSPCIIGIAVDGNGDLWGYDIVNDNFLFIDKTTGTSTPIGPIGFDANFGQGMTWDPVTDQLFMVAFNNTAFQPELRVVDRNTGNTTFLGVLGATDPGGLTQLAFLAIPGAQLGDDLDPNPPENVVAYSDYTTPTEMLLTWTDPTTLVDGTPITPSDFTIEIERDGVPIASVPGGTQTYTDMGLTDGTYYTYSLYAKLVANDSTSVAVSASWYAGGSPVPSPPTNLMAVGDTTTATLTWTDPTTQDDGTPLD
ncbi:MAG: fibronectin type III domain-containing protein, partial [Calditrichaeota bacterium]